MVDVTTEEVCIGGGMMTEGSVWMMKWIGEDCDRRIGDYHGRQIGKDGDIRIWEEGDRYIGEEGGK